MDYGYLNLASLLLGLIAIFIPFFQKAAKFSSIKMIVSFSLSLIAVNCQIAYQKHLVDIQDFSAIEDTTSGVLMASTILITLTILANVVSIMRVERNRN